MLSRCDIAFTCFAPELDEVSILASLISEKKKPIDIARFLAEMKARKIDRMVSVSGDEDGLPKPYVLGCDQILVCEGKIYSKSIELSHLRENLLRLKGREHVLYSAAAVVREEVLLWSHCASARVYIRDFSEEFLDSYLSRYGEDVLSSVGGYRVEEEGALLFSRLSADPYVVQGLPLLELLAFLREQGLENPLL